MVTTFFTASRVGGFAEADAKEEDEEQISPFGLFSPFGCAALPVVVENCASLCLFWALAISL